MTKPTVIAHRGFSAVAPENTLPAFQHAIDAGADMIEYIEIRADGQRVLRETGHSILYALSLIHI